MGASVILGGVRRSPRVAFAPRLLLRALRFCCLPTSFFVAAEGLPQQPIGDGEVGCADPGERVMEIEEASMGGTLEHTQGPSDAKSLAQSGAARFPVVDQEKVCLELSRERDGFALARVNRERGIDMGWDANLEPCGTGAKPLTNLLRGAGMQHLAFDRRRDDDAAEEPR